MVNIGSIAVFGLSLGLALGALAPLDDFSTKSLDTLVRKKLMFMVVSQLNDTIELQDSLKHQCSVKINQSLVNCKACAASHNQQAPSGVLGVLLPTLMQPVMAAGNLVKDIEGSLENAAAVLGDKTTDFVKDVGSVAKHAGNSLIHGVSDITGDALKGLTHFGDQLAGMAGDIGHGLDTAVHGLESGTLGFGSNIGSGLESIGNQLSHGAQGALDGLSHLGSQIGHAGSSVGHAIGNIGHSIGDIFGKRSVCPICDSLDTKAHSVAQILADVCGAHNVHQQHAVTAKLQKLKKIYDSAVGHAVISKVEYDAGSIDVSHGVAFKTVFVTYTIGGKTTRYATHVPLRITALPVTGDALGLEIYGK